MPKAQSVDLRVRVLAAVASGLSNRQAGERFALRAASVTRWRQLEKERVMRGRALLAVTGARTPRNGMPKRPPGDVFFRAGSQFPLLAHLARSTTGSDFGPVPSSAMRA